MFAVWPKTPLLRPLWPRAAKSLDTLVLNKPWWKRSASFSFPSLMSVCSSGCWHDVFRFPGLGVFVFPGDWELVWWAWSSELVGRWEVYIEGLVPFPFFGLDLTDVVD